MASIYKFIIYREKRDISPDQLGMEFELEAFGSTLKVSLDSNTELFPHSPQLTVVDRWSSTTEPLDISQFYQGHVMGKLLTGHHL